MKKKLTFIILLAVALVMLFSCADKEVVTSCLKGQTYGFWFGIWHGMIAPFDLIGMLIWDDVTVFAQNNSGFCYALGFLIGSGGWGVIGNKASKKRY
jgi:hypothetical protein